MSSDSSEGTSSGSSSSGSESREDPRLSDAEGGEDAGMGGMGGGAGFADALQKILTKSVKGQDVVLAKRKTPNMKKIEQEKEVERAQKRARKEKQERDRMCMVLPSEETREFEKNLRKIATKGVVAFFNTINEAQNPKKKKGEDGSSTKPVSKEKFFDMIQNKTSGKPSSSSSSSSKGSAKKTEAQGSGSGHGSNWLNDNYMMGAKMKNWDEEDSENDSVSELEVEDEDED